MRPVELQRFAELNFMRLENKTLQIVGGASAALVTGHSPPALPVHELIQPALVTNCGKHQVLGLPKRIEQ